MEQKIMAFNKFTSDFYRKQIDEAEDTLKEVMSDEDMNSINVYNVNFDLQEAVNKYKEYQKRKIKCKNCAHYPTSGECIIMHGENKYIPDDCMEKNCLICPCPDCVDHNHFKGKS